MTLNTHLLIGTLLVSQFLSCGSSERNTQVRFEGGNPPIFVISGSGKLSDLIVYGPRQRETGGDRAFAVWEIKPKGGRNESLPLDDLRKIQYGVVPKNYVQVYPEDNASPPSLVEGQRYEYWFQTLNAPHARAYFEIQGGKPVELSR